MVSNNLKDTPTNNLGGANFLSRDKCKQKYDIASVVWPVAKGTPVFVFLVETILDDQRITLWVKVIATTILGELCMYPHYLVKL